MKSSIRQFLIVTLLASTILLWILTLLADAAVNQRDIRKSLDSQLRYTAELISALTHEDPHKQIQLNLKKVQFQHFQFQLFNEHNQLLLRSQAAPLTEYTNIQKGFLTADIQDETWRFYINTDTRNGERIIVAGKVATIDALALTVFKNTVVIMMIAILILALLICLITEYSLRYIKQLSSALTNRAATHLAPIKTADSPEEFKPLVAEMNNLFTQIRQTMERNKRFASDAAHELRTPLAALKTQAEVARKSQDDSERSLALRNVIKGVDRSTHLVEQLLTLGRLGPEATLNDITPIDPEKLAAEIVALLVPKAIKKNIEIELIANEHEQFILANEISIAILMRNLVDNAIRYTPENGFVKVSILSSSKLVIFRVEDSGPGIPEDLHARIFERFYRVLGTEQTGSGLGLAIVKQVADLHRAKIKLSKPSNGQGLRVDAVFTKVKPS